MTYFLFSLLFISTLSYASNNMKTDIIWSNVLNNIKNEVNSLTFDTWFKETKLYSLKNNNAYIIVPMPLHKRLLKVSYNELIVEKLHEETDSEDS